MVVGTIVNDEIMGGLFERRSVAVDVWWEHKASKLKHLVQRNFFCLVTNEVALSVNTALVLVF